MLVSIAGTVRRSLGQFGQLTGVSDLVIRLWLVVLYKCPSDVNLSCASTTDRRTSARQKPNLHLQT